MDKTHLTTVFLLLFLIGSVSAQSIVGTYYSLRFYPEMANKAYVHTNVMYKGLEVSENQQITIYQQDDFGLEFKNDQKDKGKLKKVGKKNLNERETKLPNLVVDIYQMDLKQGIDREIIHISEFEMFIIRINMPGGFTIDAAYVKADHSDLSFAQYCKSVLNYHLLKFEQSDLSIYTPKLQHQLETRRDQMKIILSRIEGKTNMEAKRIFAEYPHGFLQISYLGHSLLM